MHNWVLTSINGYVEAIGRLQSIIAGETSGIQKYTLGLGLKINLKYFRKESGKINALLKEVMPTFRRELFKVSLVTSDPGANEL